MPDPVPKYTITIFMEFTLRSVIKHSDRTQFRSYFLNCSYRESNLGLRRQEPAVQTIRYTISSDITCLLINYFRGKQSIIPFLKMSFFIFTQYIIKILIENEDFVKLHRKNAFKKIFLAFLYYIRV